MYDRLVDQKVLTFCVSGKLWNRSLVMQDIETKTLWSHILGAAMEGELQGTQLATRPADIVTWSAWQKAWPETTVLDMSRTNRDYTREFYRSLEPFVIGFQGARGMHHCSLATLDEHPLLHVDAHGLPLLLTFDPESTSARVFRRTVNGQTLKFSRTDDGTLRDDQTGSIWNRHSGEAIAGPLADQKLTPHIAILSRARSWLTFHPESQAVASDPP